MEAEKEEQKTVASVPTAGEGEGNDALKQTQVKETTTTEPLPQNTAATAMEVDEKPEQKEEEKKEDKPEATSEPAKPDEQTPAPTTTTTTTQEKKTEEVKLDESKGTFVPSWTKGEPPVPQVNTSILRQKSWVKTCESVLSCVSGATDGSVADVQDILDGVLLAAKGFTGEGATVCRKYFTTFVCLNILLSEVVVPMMKTMKVQAGGLAELKKQLNESHYRQIMT